MEHLERPIIKFTHSEVEALLNLYPLDENEFTPSELSARNKLKQIFARQVLSHEKKQRDEKRAK